MTTYPLDSIITSTDDHEFTLRVPVGHPLAKMLESWLIVQSAIQYLEAAGYDVAQLKARFGFFPQPQTINKYLDNAIAILKRHQTLALFVADVPTEIIDFRTQADTIDEIGAMEVFIGQLRSLK